MRLHQLLAVTFGGLALALSAGGSFVARDIATSRLREQIGSELTGIAGQVRDGLDRGMFERLRDIQIAATLDPMRDPSVSIDAKRAILKRLHDTYPSYAIVAFAGPEGRILATSNRLIEGADVSGREYFIEGKKRPFTADVHDAVLLAKLLGNDPNDPPRFVDLAAPVTADDGRLVGVVAAHLHWDWAKEVQASLVGPLRERRPGLEVFILSRNGTVLLGPPEFHRRKLSDDLIAAYQAMPRHSGSFLTSWGDGQEYLSGVEPTRGYRDYEGLGWTVLVRQSSSAAFADAQRLGTEIMVAGVLLALVFALIGWWAAGRIARPLLELVRVADGLRAGDEKASWPETTGYVEVSTLSASLRALVARLAERRESATEAERAKAYAESANRAKTDFLASMSHEIRTPLNSILGFGNLLLERDLAPEERRFATNVRNAATDLLTLVNEVLDFSKIEEGKIEYEDVPFPLAEVVEGARILLDQAAVGKGLGLRVSIAPTVPAFVTGDPARIKQVLVNLLGNAVKFTRIGGVELRVSAPRSGWLRFEVMDSGIGIPPDKIPLLFQRFTQVEASTTRQYGGSGLGLAICKRLVEGMNGEIGVDSVPGRGTTFWFEVPLPEAEAPLPPEVGPAPSGVTALPSRILLVDDVAMNRELVLGLLAWDGHSIDVAENGAQAVQKVQTRSYDVVLMDVQMPVMDGYEATRAIRRIAGPAGQVPIVAMTANALPALVARCREAGMNDHIAKPLTRAALVQAIAAWTSGDRPAATARMAEPAESADPGRAFREQMPPQLLGPYLQDLAKRLAVLEAAQAAGDIEREAHRLVATAGQLGFMELSEACRALMDACMEAAPDLAPLRHAVRQAAERIQPEIDRLSRASLALAG